jgi:hypothetical protein
LINNILISQDTRLEDTIKDKDPKDIIQEIEISIIIILMDILKITKKVKQLKE